MKPRNKYARIGQFVKIVTPKEFARCGYPLSIKDIMNRDFEQIEKDCARMFAALESKPLPIEEVLTEKNEFDLGFLTVSAMEGSNMSPTVHGMICSAIAAYRLEQLNYGGNDRIIVEKDGGPFETGQLWQVTGKRVVKTGKRFSATCYRDDDYEPGGLNDEKTHMVYSVKRFAHESKILATHCEAVK